MISLGKEIRKRNFSKNIINKLSRLDVFFAIFFYESRKHPIWRAVLDSVIKAPFTPDSLLKYLDTLYRRDAAEYMNFFAVLQQNSSLTRVIYLIESMKELEKIDQKDNTDFNSEEKSEEIMSLPKLNNYSHHWFPGIVLACVKQTLLYKTSIERVYDELYDWRARFEYSNIFASFLYYGNEPENPQKINPLFNNILDALLSHQKVPTKVLQAELDNQDPKIRKLIALSPNTSSSILQKLITDPDDYIRKIALFKYTLLKKEKTHAKNVVQEEEKGSSNQKVVIAPADIQDALEDNNSTKYY